MFLSKCPSDTKRKGEEIGKKALQWEAPLVISLAGNLGGGKTTFVQGIAKGMGVKEDITSPTFVIYKRYKGERGKTLYHFDTYRVEEKDLLELGLEKIVKNKENVVVVEWGKKIKNALPKERMEIEFSFLGSRERELIVKDRSGIITGSF